jgi:hypothetical protein
VDPFFVLKLKGGRVAPFTSRGVHSFQKKYFNDNMCVLFKCKPHIITSGGDRNCDLFLLVPSVQSAIIQSTSCKKTRNRQARVTYAEGAVPWTRGTLGAVVGPCQ